jgi:hypothetical protein
MSQSNRVSLFSISFILPTYDLPELQSCIFFCYINETRTILCGSLKNYRTGIFYKKTKVTHTSVLDCLISREHHYHHLDRSYNLQH